MAKPASPSGIDRARELAVRALTAVLSQGRTLDEAFAELLPAEGSREPLERAWLLDVAAGTLRWKGRLDLAIDSAALKKKPTGWLRKALLVAGYQLLAQDRVPAAIVVSETVDSIKRKEGEAPGKFANAVLRKIADHAADWRELPMPSAGDETAAAAAASLPPWFWARLVKDHGRDWAWAFAKASLARPDVWVRAKDASPVVGAEPGPLPGSWRVTGAVTALADFGGGRVIAQDLSNQLLVTEITEAVRAALGPGPLSALDLCAAPGGKSIGLLWNGFDVLASDSDPRRYELLRASLARVEGGSRARVVPREEVPNLAPVDFAWVDAPCTGSGIIRRHPEVRWLRQEKELAALETLQTSLVREGWGRVRPGGFLAFTVCSVFAAEGPARLVSANLAGATELKRWLLAPQADLRGDGFWGVLLRKS